ncbi:MAG: patatin-like phospholipase family protein [Alphaproteobacteria bacterium]|nr:patatin-like phospholipase family protein [Alphaproteobacteria bacterium]
MPDSTPAVATNRRHVHPHPEASAAVPSEVKSINLALQGGGAHGAFTWGVLDRLLEEPAVAFEGISATSAGAMNAVVLAYGFAEGGRDGARRALANFWRRVSHAAATSPLQPTMLDKWFGNAALEWSPAYLAFDLMTRLMSPYQFNPSNFNPLKRVLAQAVDFERLRSHCCPIRLFLSATNVRTGRVKLFGNDEVSLEAVMASACLPFLFQAVEIDGEAYWDGGYMGNPAIFPLIYNCDSADVVIVHINPIERAEIPRTAGEIMNRINEVSFNSSLMREMRAIDFVTSLIDSGAVADRGLKRMRLHAIAAHERMCGFSIASKLNADWDFLTQLRDIGRETASTWLSAHLGQVGHESTVDIRGTYL